MIRRSKPRVNNRRSIRRLILFLVDHRSAFLRDLRHVGDVLILLNNGCLQFLVSLRLMDDLILHKLVEITRFPISGHLSFLDVFLLMSEDSFLVDLLFDSLLILVPHLLGDSLLRVKHESVHALGNLLFNAKLFLPPLQQRSELILNLVMLLNRR